MCPLSTAQYKGVPPSLSLALTLAPLLISSSAVSVCPLCTAQCKGVKPPLLFPALTLAPLLISSSAIFVCPLSTAQCKGVSPSLSLALTLAPLLISSSAVFVCDRYILPSVKVFRPLYLSGIDLGSFTDKQFGYFCVSFTYCPV